MDIETLKTDPAAISEGRWIGDIPGMGDLELRVRGLSSPAVQQLQSRKLRALPKAERDRDGRPSPEAAARISGEVLAESVLLDWRNVSVGGKAVKFDPALAKKWLTDPAYSRFADAVTTAASYVDNGEVAATEALAGN